MGYYSALEAAGCTVLDYTEFGSYQGEWLACVSYQGEIGIVEGSYGSCSGCDAFEAEFGYSDSDEEDYNERLASFGESYLPPLPFGHYVEQLEKRVKEYDWDDEAKLMLDYVKSNMNKYNKEI